MLKCFCWVEKLNIVFHENRSHRIGTQPKSEKKIRSILTIQTRKGERERKRKRAGIYSNITSLLAISFANKEFWLEERSFYICSSSHFTNHENEPWTRHFFLHWHLFINTWFALDFCSILQEKKVAQKLCVYVCVTHSGNNFPDFCMIKECERFYDRRRNTLKLIFIFLLHTSDKLQQ